MTTAPGTLDFRLKGIDEIDCERLATLARRYNVEKSNLGRLADAIAAGESWHHAAPSLGIPLPVAENLACIMNNSRSLG